MPKLTLRGAYIRFVDLRFDEKSKTVYTKINCTAVFSEPVRQAMEWGEPPAGFGAASLDGEFTATNLVMTPNGRELKQHEMQLGAKEIGKFEFHRVKSESGDSTQNELRFQIITADPEAAAKLREYLAAIGRGEAQMRVNYEENAELDLEESDDQERLISEEQAADTADDGPSLASAREVGEGRRKKVRTMAPVN